MNFMAVAEKRKAFEEWCREELMIYMTGTQGRESCGATGSSGCGMNGGLSMGRAITE